MHACGVSRLPAKGCSCAARRDRVSASGSKGGKSNGSSLHVGIRLEPPCLSVRAVCVCATMYALSCRPSGCVASLRLCVFVL